jgi:hypothetical protein
MANAYSLDVERSSSQFASRADASLVGLDITGSLTIEAWIKLESLPGAGEYYGIVSKMDDINTGANNSKSQWGLWYDNDSARRLQFFLRESGANNSVVHTVTLNTGQWYHVACTFRSSTHMKLFLDGVEVASSTTSIPASSVNTAQPFVVGGMDGGSYFDGLIDEVRVWNTFKDATAIAASKDVELVGNESNLQGYFRLENNYNDTTANGNTLTPSGSPVFSTDVPFTGLTFQPRPVACGNPMLY